MHPRYPLKDPSALLSPSLLIYKALVVQNLESMIRLAGSADRLRPHAKTHKMEAVIRLSEEMGISKHKCATLAEAEMIAAAGGTDVLLAYPVVGPNIPRLASLRREYPATTFRVLVDDPEVAQIMSDTLEADEPLPVLVDLEIGMARTGCTPAAAEGLVERIDRLPNLVFDGLHGYDGHIREIDVEARRAVAREGIDQVLALRDRLTGRGFAVNRLVLGGTPTFPIHAELDAEGVECSPGTTTLYDNGYGLRFPDLPFVPAAVLLTRVISRPRPGRLCLDLGHKAVAADPVGDRLTLLGVPEGTLGGQSEEHLVVLTPHADQFPPGTPLFAIPTHICPTCALHRRVYVIEDGELVDEWDVTARDRVLA